MLDASAFASGETAGAKHEPDGQYSVRQKSWFIILLGHAFLVQAIAILLRMAIVYQSAAIRLGDLWIGIIGGAFGLLPAVLGLHVGRYIDRRGETLALIWGSAAMMAAAIALTLAPDYLLTLLLGSIALGTGQFLGIVSQQSAASKTAGPDRAKSLGTLTLAIAMAQAAGPLGVSLLSNGSVLPDTQNIFEAGTVLCAISLAFALLISLPHHPPSTAKQGVFRTAMTLVRIPGYQLATYSSLVIFGAMDLLVMYLPLYGMEQNISASTIGVLLSVRATASIISRFLFSRLLLWLGREMLLLLSLGISAAAIGLLMLTASPWLMAISLFCAGLGLGLGAPLTLAWLADIVPPEIRGSAFSLRLAVNRVGQSTLPVGAGLLAGPLGIAGVFLAMALSLGINTAVAARIYLRQG